MPSSVSSPEYSRPCLRWFHLLGQRMCSHDHLQHFMGSLARFAGSCVKSLPFEAILHDFSLSIEFHPIFRHRYCIRERYLSMEAWLEPTTRCSHLLWIHCNRRSILFAIMGNREEGTCFLINVHSFVFTLHSTLIRDSTLRDHQAWKYSRWIITDYRTLLCAVGEKSRAEEHW